MEKILAQQKLPFKCYQYTNETKDEFVKELEFIASSEYDEDENNPCITVIGDSMEHVMENGEWVVIWETVEDTMFDVYSDEEFHNRFEKIGSL